MVDELNTPVIQHEITKDRYSIKCKEMEDFCKSFDYPDKFICDIEIKTLDKECLCMYNSVMSFFNKS